MRPPPRQRGHEILDDATVDAATRLRSIGDVTRSNRLFGGMRAAVREVERALEGCDAQVSLLDVGTGLADIPGEILTRAKSRGVTITTIGVDEAHDLLRDARSRLSAPVCGNARSLPFRDKSFDIVLCSQLLHHFADDDLCAIISELDRVARRCVVIADLRRSRIAAAGFWLASIGLGFDPVTRHDGVVSVYRGFSASELRRAISTATRVKPRVETWLGFRLTASWTPATLT